MADVGDPVDTGNYQMVAMGGAYGEIGVLFPRETMTAEQALVHAAWLVSLADPLGERWAEVLAAVQNT